MSRNNNSSFTLIELLVVLALAAILSVVVVLTLNPAELLKQARDSNRLSDLATVNTALNLFSTDVINGFMGTSTTVYVSIPDSSPTCANLGLPTLPTSTVAWTYNCVTAANLRNTNGTGWIPVNFQRISSNSPISQLPIDPTNTTSTRLYYTYVSGGSWELNATVEASKNKLGGSNDLVSKDGGSATSQYELGNNLSLNPIETGDSSLVGYWNFEEGPNATSTDRSGYGNHGTWYGTSTAQQHYAVGKVGSYAGYFNGGSDYVSCRDGGSLELEQNLSLNTWVNFNQLKDYSYPLLKMNGISGGNLGVNYRLMSGAANMNGLISNGTTTNTATIVQATTGVVIGEWVMVTFTADGAKVNLYVNGNLKFSGYQSINPIGSTSTMLYIGSSSGGASNVNGFLDDVRIYNRALSDSEILALYNVTK